MRLPSKEVVMREIREEVKINFEIINLFCINENLYNSGGKIEHEICYYNLNILYDLSYDNFEIKR